MGDNESSELHEIKELVQELLKETQAAEVANRERFHKIQRATTAANHPPRVTIWPIRQIRTRAGRLSA